MRCDTGERSRSSGEYQQNQQEKARQYRILVEPEVVGHVNSCDRIPAAVRAEVVRLRLLDSHGAGLSALQAVAEAA